jgi:hypothetical protein
VPVCSSFQLRRVWRYQRGNQNPKIEEEQTTQWPKEKVQKDKQRSTKHTHKTKDRVTRTPLKLRGWTKLIPDKWSSLIYQCTIISHFDFDKMRFYWEIHVWTCLCLNLFMSEPVYVWTCLCLNLFMSEPVYVWTCLCLNLFMELMSTICFNSPKNEN